MSQPVRRQGRTPPCLSHAEMSHSQKHPVILSGHDIIAKLMFNYYHVSLGHCGPTLLLSHASQSA